METLKVDFYESGKGDTIVITFPSGGLGIVDAHPSPRRTRPDILSIVGDKDIHFVCLTHPHADHGEDLPQLIRRAKKPIQFWHTASEINSFVYRLQEVKNFPGGFGEYARNLAKGWAQFHIRLFGAAIEEKIDMLPLRADLQPIEIDGVRIHVLSPEVRQLNKVHDYWLKKAGDVQTDLFNVNLLSAILAFEFGDSVVLLGADALQENWDDAVPRARKAALKKAAVLKVPHHGAANAISLRKHNKRPTYLDLCRHEGDQKCHAVLLAGDARHPDERVNEKLRARTLLFCSSSGMNEPVQPANPLGISIQGARAVTTPPVCNPVIGFELKSDGIVKTTAGLNCTACAHRSV